MRMPQMFVDKCVKCGGLVSFTPDTASLRYYDTRTRRGYRTVAFAYYTCPHCGARQLHAQDGPVGSIPQFKAVK